MLGCCLECYESCLFIHIPRKLEVRCRQNKIVPFNIPKLELFIKLTYSWGDTGVPYKTHRIGSKCGGK